MADSGSLSAAKKRTLAALLSSRTIAEAADKANVSERSIYRWLAQDAAFCAELSKQETSLLSLAASALASELATCLDVVAKIRDDSEETAAARLRAVSLWINTLLRLTELQTVLARLDRLEARFYEGD